VGNSIAGNRLYLHGTWNFDGEFAGTKDPQAKVIFRYNAKNVYMVLSGAASGTASGVAKVGIYVDGVMTKTMSVQEHQLYTIVEGTDYREHTVEIRLESGELEVYTFTFG
jgi:hypothetical protein